MDKKTWKKILFSLLIGFFLFFSLVLINNFHNKNIQAVPVISFSNFYNSCRKREIKSVVVYDNHILATSKNSMDPVFKVYIPQGNYLFVNDIKTLTNVTFNRSNSVLISIFKDFIRGFLPTILFYFLIMRYMVRGNGGETNKNENSEEIPVLNEIVGFGSIVEDMRKLLKFWYLNNRTKSRDQDHLYTVLFKGKPGTGKTFMANVLAKTSKASFLKIDISSSGSSFIHQTSKNIQEIFNEARRRAKQGLKVIIFIDEADSVLQSREAMQNSLNQEHTEVVTTLLKNISGIRSPYEKKILVVCSTNHDNLDPAFKSRVAKTFIFNNPTYEDRLDLMEFYSKKEFDDVTWGDFSLVSKLTFGENQRDIKNIMLNAVVEKKSNVTSKEEKVCVNEEDIITAIISRETCQEKVIRLYEKELIAYHEAGHGFLGGLFHIKKFLSVDVVGIGMTFQKSAVAGGMTFFGVGKFSAHTEDTVMREMYSSKVYLLSDLIICLGGKSGELLGLNVMGQQNINESIYGWDGDLQMAVDVINRLYVGGIDFGFLCNQYWKFLDSFLIFDSSITILISQGNMISNISINSNNFIDVLQGICNKTIIRKIIIDGYCIDNIECNFENLMANRIKENRTQQHSKREFFGRLCNMGWLVTNLIMYKFKKGIIELTAHCKDKFLTSEDDIKLIINKYLVT